MKNFKKIFIVLPLLVVLLGACTQKKEEDELAKTLPRLDELAGNFRTVVDYKTYHYALLVNYGPSGYLADSALHLRNGSLPYTKANTGSFSVATIDANGKELSRYSIEDPRKRRVCEEGKSLNEIIDNGSFELLLPSTQGQVKMILFDEGKEISTLLLPEKIIRPDRRNPNLNKGNDK